VDKGIALRQPVEERLAFSFSRDWKPGTRTGAAG